MNSLESTNTLSNSPSETGSEMDSGIFSPMGRNLSKTSPPNEWYQKQIENLEQMLKKKDEIVTGIQDKYKHFKEDYQELLEKNKEYTSWPFGPALSVLRCGRCVGAVSVLVQSVYR